jgi:UDP-glucose 4-epimerase
MTWMLTGGAGYIGAHVTRALRDSGRDVVVLDDLSTGLAPKVPDGVPFEQVDVCDRAAVADVLRRHEVTGVVHLAAKKAVGESVERPHFYYRQNVEGAMALTEAMAEVGVRRLVYSSSASVYGPTDAPLITEDADTLPISPYGQTKLIGEWIGADLAVAQGFSVVALRYFNVAGAGGDDLGDTGAFNLIPLVLRAHTQGARPKIFGADYPTPDGTCIRDYIHITDLAAGHVAAAVRTEADEAGFAAYNLGRGIGSSVREVIDAVSDALGVELDPEIVDRRPGDPPLVVASADRARDELGWVAQRSLADMCTSAWSAWQAHPPA